MGSGDTVHLQCVPPRAQPEATVRFLKDGQPFIDANGLALTFAKPFSHSSSHPSTSINNEALDGFFPLADAERFKLLSDGTLRIHNAQPKDNGRYSCVAENLVDTRESAPALLTVFGESSVKNFACFDFFCLFSVSLFSRDLRTLGRPKFKCKISASQSAGSVSINYLGLLQPPLSSRFLSPADAGGQRRLC